MTCLPREEPVCPLTEHPGLFGRRVLCRGWRPLLEAGRIDGRPVLVLYDETLMGEELTQALAWLQLVWRLQEMRSGPIGDCTHWNTVQRTQGGGVERICRTCQAVVER